jgi:hypothetical protein
MRAPHRRRRIKSLQYMSRSHQELSVQTPHIAAAQAQPASQEAFRKDWSNGMVSSLGGFSWTPDPTDRQSVVGARRSLGVAYLGLDGFDPPMSHLCH